MTNWLRAGSGRTTAARSTIFLFFRFDFPANGEHAAQLLLDAVQRETIVGVNAESAKRALSVIQEHGGVLQFERGKARQPSSEALL